LIDLFSDTSLIPKSAISEVQPAFFPLQFPASVESDHLHLSYLKALGRRMNAAISHLPFALWTRSFPEFLTELIATIRVEPEVSYFAPLDAENSLARFLFGPFSAHRARIDALCEGIVKIGAEDFVTKLVGCCNDLVPNRESLSIADQSMCLVLMYRALFNRCYELHPSFFFGMGGQPDLIRKAKALGEAQAGCFTVPWHLVPKMPPTTAISRLYAGDPNYTKAADHLFTAIFGSNPIDQLFEIHRALVMIHRGAMIVSKGPDGADKAELLAFDDLFALFFGAMTVSALPDLFFLQKMIDDYAPKAWLSPPFEYAQANLEALVLHCIQFDTRPLRPADDDPPP
jgi:hypothetical protein